MRRERQVPRSAPVLPFLGWVLTWAAVELSMLQRLLDTVSLTGAQWVLVLLLSMLSPALVLIDKAVQLRRLDQTSGGDEARSSRP